MLYFGLNHFSFDLKVIWSCIWTTSVLFCCCCFSFKIQGFSSCPSCPCSFWTLFLVRITQTECVLSEPYKMALITESILHPAFFSLHWTVRLLSSCEKKVPSDVSAYFALKWQTHNMELQFSIASSGLLCVWLLHIISFLLFQASNCSFACVMLLSSELKNNLSKLLSWAHCKAQQLGRHCLGADVQEDFTLLRQTADITLIHFQKHMAVEFFYCVQGLKQLLVMLHY